MIFRLMYIEWTNVYRFQCNNKSTVCTIERISRAEHARAKYVYSEQYKPKQRNTKNQTEETFERRYLYSLPYFMCRSQTLK